MKCREELNQIHAEIDFDSWRLFIEEAHRHSMTPCDFYFWLQELDPRDPTGGGFSVFMMEPLWHLSQRIKAQVGPAHLLKWQLKVFVARTMMGSSDVRKPQKTVFS
jgi:hypothetical protein